MTYLELVNDVLARLREQQVTTVNLTTYSSLIGKFVNDAKRQVEDAYDWNALGQEINVTTSASVYEYSLTGVGQKFRVTSDPINTTSNTVLEVISSAEMRRKQNLQPFVNSIPTQYVFDGVDNNGDAKAPLPASRGRPWPALCPSGLQPALRRSLPSASEPRQAPQPESPSASGPRRDLSGTRRDR